MPSNVQPEVMLTKGVLIVLLLAAMNGVLTLFTIWRDRRRRDASSQMLLSPLTVISVGMTIRYGIGPAIMVITNRWIDDGFVRIWLERLDQITLAGSALHCTIISGCLLIEALESITGRRYGLINAKSRTIQSERKRYLELADWLGWFVCGSYIAGMLSGAYERQYGAYVEWVTANWRLDMLFIAFGRLKDIWFVCLPILIRHRKGWRRLYVLLPLALYFTSVILSGSRGALLYPLMYVLVGVWLFIRWRKWMTVATLSTVMIVLLTVPTVYALRETPEYQAETYITNKVAGISRLIKEPGRIIEKFQWTGRDLIACHDPFVFREKGRPDWKPAGWNDIGLAGNMLLPRMLGGERQNLFDGSDIARRLQGVENEEWAQVWFPCISLAADLLRRGAEGGLLLGGFIVGIILGFLQVGWRTIVERGYTVATALIALIPVTYLSSFPLGTVKETVWYALFDLGKYVLLAIFLNLLIVLRSKRQELQ